MKMVLQTLRDKQLFGSCTKVKFGFKKWYSWERVIPEERIRMNPKEMEAVVSWERPTIIKEIRSFPGLASYYRVLFPNFSPITLPMTKLIRKNRHFGCLDKCEASLRFLKGELFTAPVLLTSWDTEGMVIYSEVVEKVWEVC